MASSAPKAKRKRRAGHPKPSKVIVPLAEQFMPSPKWTKARYETPTYYNYFSLFRDMGPDRSRIQVAEDIGVSPANISKVASRFRWDERAEAFDRHLDEIKLKQMEKDHRQMAGRQASLGMKLQEVALVGAANLDVSELSARDVSILAEVGTKIERTARGEKQSQDLNITLNLPMIPSWAQQSRFLKADPNLKPQVTIERVEVEQPKMLPASAAGPPKGES